MITEDIRYIGVNDHDIDLFEGQYQVPNGISYNSYVIMDEKIAIMDTVDKRKQTEFLENLETALADAYYGATILYPEQFADVDVEAKTGEIFEMLLGSNPYQDLKDAGYEFRPVTIGE